MTNRRGASLIELMVVITTSMIIIGLAIGMVHTLVGANRTAERHLVRSESVGRLCESFRRHVREAAAAECIEEDGAIRLELSFDDGRQVVFRSAEQAVFRTEREEGVDRRRDKYTLAKDSFARFEIQSEKDSTTVTLVIAHAPTRPDEGPACEFRADATLDRDLRFASKGK